MRPWQTGLAVIVEQRPNLLSGRRWGLVTQAAAVLPDLTGSVEALLGAGINLTALFGPEHGLYGAAPAGAAVGDAVDSRSGLPVYSLYGASTTLDPTLLDGLDGLIFDMQDAGARFYTYLSTLHAVLRGAAQAGRPVVLLDRPNPIGARIEGPLLEPDYRSFVGSMVGLPIRHAMTFGELARWICAREQLSVAVEVIPLRGWRRADWFDACGLAWVPPSPAMPHLSTAALYPGMCLLEGTNLSEGRGTSLPFALAGAPWLDGRALAEHCNRLDLPGARFRPVEFVPTASKYAGQRCTGVQLHVLDRAIFAPVTTALHLIAAACQLAPEQFAFLPPPGPTAQRHFDLLAGTATVREGLTAGLQVEQITAGWTAQQAAFWTEVQPYLLYQE